MIPLGQFRDTFIIAIDDEGVAIIDQHVAHERVLFERVMQQLTAGMLESQRLLVPLLIDLSPASHQAILARASELTRLGYELESFGDATVKVSAVPALLSANDSATALAAPGSAAGCVCTWPSVPNVGSGLPSARHFAAAKAVCCATP